MIIFCYSWSVQRSMDKNSHESRMAIKKGGKKNDKPPKDGSRAMKKKGRVSGSGNDDDSVDNRGNIKGLIDYSDDDDMSDSSSEGSISPRSRPPRRAAAKAALERIHERFLNEKPKNTIEMKEEEEDLGEEDSYDSEESDEDDLQLEDTQGKIKPPGINITFGSFGKEESIAEKMVPKRHDMKKESEITQKFVNLVTNPPEEITIDDQIEQFKSLPSPQQKNMIESLESRPKSDANQSGQNMMFRILTMKVKPDIKNLILSKYNSLQTLDSTSSEYFKLRNWLEKATSIPLGDYTDMPVKLEDGPDKCGDFMKNARACLDSAIYGQAEAKLQILQFIASKITNPNARGLSLLLAGPPGIGKTALIKNGIAKALGWPFQFISLGGDSDASTYTGHQVVYEGSHSGKIVNSIITAKSLSMVLMFDEVDKISSTPKGEEVQHLLIHLTDPVQNDAFEDKYLSGIPIDLSRIMFVFSANDIHKLDRILLDRFVVIELEGYKKSDKAAIAEKFLWPEALNEVNLGEKVALGKDVLETIIDEYCNDESGVRDLRRALIQIAQKINMLRMFNTQDLPFHIPNFALPFLLKKEHIKLFLNSKKESRDKPPLGMYN